MLKMQYFLSEIFNMVQGASYSNMKEHVANIIVSFLSAD